MEPRAQRHELIFPIFFNPADINKENPLSVANPRHNRNPTNPTSDAGKAENTAVKKKPNSKKFATAKNARQSSTYQQLKEAQQEQHSRRGRRRRQDSATENDLEDDAEDSEGRDPQANQIWLPDDPGFEEAFQASRRSRPRAQDTEQSPRGAPRAPPRRDFSTTPLTNHPVHDDSNSESREEADIDGSNLMAPPSETTIAPQQSSDEPTPAPRRQAINPLTE